MPRARFFPSTSQRAILTWDTEAGSPLVVGTVVATLTQEMVAWPSSLPLWPLIEGYQEAGAEITVRSSLDTSSARVRRRSGTEVRPYTLLFHMTKPQVETLDAFFNLDCAGGGRPFLYKDLHILTPLVYRFTDSPRYVPRGDQQNWTVTCPVEAYQRVP